MLRRMRRLAALVIVLGASHANADAPHARNTSSLLRTHDDEADGALRGLEARVAELRARNPSEEIAHVLDDVAAAILKARQAAHRHDERGSLRARALAQVSLLLADRKESRALAWDALVSASEALRRAHDAARDGAADLAGVPAGATDVRVEPAQNRLDPALVAHVDEALHAAEEATAAGDRVLNEEETHLGALWMNIAIETFGRDQHVAERHRVEEQLSALSHDVDAHAAELRERENARALEDARTLASAELASALSRAERDEPRRGRRYVSNDAEGAKESFNVLARQVERGLVALRGLGKSEHELRPIEAELATLRARQGSARTPQLTQISALWTRTSALLTESLEHTEPGDL